MMSVPSPVQWARSAESAEPAKSCAPALAATANSTLPKSARTKGFMTPSKRSLKSQGTCAGLPLSCSRADPTFLDYLTPTLALSCNCHSEFLRRPQRQLQPLSRHPLTYFRSLERLRLRH